MFSKKATKIEEIFTFDLTVCSKCQIDGEDFIKFCSLLGKYELYRIKHPLDLETKNSDFHSTLPDSLKFDLLPPPNC